MDIKEKVRALPATPGVYIMKEASGAVLYVGKAGNLRKRVSSYFYGNASHSERIKIMVSKVSDIECVMTMTEAEALIYENSLIKQLEPKYNVALRDDKSYPFLKLSVSEDFPRLVMTRKKADDGSLYFGPYTNARLLREAVVTLKRLFPLRTCFKMPKRSCLNYHIGQCVGPCVGKIDKAAYNDIVEQLRLFLEGKKSELIKILTKNMLESSKLHDFEKANSIKRRIEALSAVRDGGLSYAPGESVSELKNILSLPVLPQRIEAFDVSNIMGTEAVGSLVSFFKGKPDKREYRKFKIKTVFGCDDYAMMREIIRRRYSRLLSERKRLPDLVLIDGGRGHLAASHEEMVKLGLANIPVIGLAKELEHIFIIGRSQPIILPKDSKALHLLQCLRDEAHRFAITYHKNLRSRKIVYSELDEIKGLGRSRKRELMNYFGSVDNIKKASARELALVKNMDDTIARRIADYFSNNSGTGEERRR